MNTGDALFHCQDWWFISVLYRLRVLLRFMRNIMHIARFRAMKNSKMAVSIGFKLL